MTNEAIYQPLPMPHGRVRPAPPPLLVEEGTLPRDLVEQARARQAETEVLVLPREAEPDLQDGDPSLAIYSDSDIQDVEVLRRGGVRVDYLAEHRKVVSQFAAVDWIDFAVAVAENISAEAVIGIAAYVMGRIRKSRQSGAEPKLDINLARSNGTFMHIKATDTDAGLKALSEALLAITIDSTKQSARSNRWRLLRARIATRVHRMGIRTLRWLTWLLAWKTWAEKRSEHFPYRGWKSVAYWLKVRLQMLVGGYAVYLLLTQTFDNEGTFLEASAVLSLVGKALATAAVIELAYTLFTPGPDEVLDPLMLGLSAALLIEFSTPEHFNYQNAIAGLLFIVGLGVLYGIRRSLERATAEEKGQRKQVNARRDEDAT